MAVRSNVLFAVPTGGFGLPASTTTTIYETPVGHMTLWKWTNILIVGNATTELYIQASPTDPLVTVYREAHSDGVVKQERFASFFVLPEGWRIRAFTSVAGNCALYGGGAELVL